MIVLSEATGRISNVIFDPIPDGFIEHYLAEGTHTVTQTDIEISGAQLCSDYYVVDGELVERPVIEGANAEIAADGEDTATYTFPDGATVKIDGEAYVLDDGRLEFATDEPGVYTIEFDAWPYLPFKVTVTAAEVGA